MIRKSTLGALFVGLTLVVGASTASAASRTLTKTTVKRGKTVKTVKTVKTRRRNKVIIKRTVHKRRAKRVRVNRARLAGVQYRFSPRLQRWILVRG